MTLLQPPSHQPTKPQAHTNTRRLKPVKSRSLSQQVALERSTLRGESRRMTGESRRFPEPPALPPLVGTLSLMPHTVSFVLYSVL